MNNSLRMTDIRNSDRTLLALAVKCRLISNEQEKQLWSVFIRKLTQDSTISILQIFKQEKILTDQDIEFLFSVQNHLLMKTLDKKFGELGVANKFINPEKVKKALDLQSEIFRETQKSKMIGDILLEQNEITKANKAAILLTQDRVRDELLAEAINDIASTELEKISINMRFGAIAVKKKYISLDQLNQALKVQKDEQGENKSKRYLGEILRELFGLSAKDLTAILNIQKELERQRLSLEKALTLYKLESNTNKRLNRLFEYRFLKNKLEAYIRIAKEVVEEVTVNDVTNWLKSIGISHGICDEQSIKAFLNNGIPGSEIKIAQGSSPTDPVNESIEFFFNTGAGLTKPIDSAPLTVRQKGDILAKIIPYQEGTPGKDVCGNDIAPPAYKSIPLGCGKGVVRKGNLFLAEIDGHPTLFKNRTLFVSPKDLSHPTENLSGNIRTDLGSQYEIANLSIDGTVETGAKIICHELVVKGDVKGQIMATGRVQIDGNALNTGEHPNIISSDKDIVITKNIFNTILITSENLLAPNADLISSKVYAFQDIILKSIYSKEETPSILQIGKKPNLRTNAINQTIIEKKQILKRLLCQDDLAEIENWFNGKIQMQNVYIEQQTILQELLKLFNDKEFERFETIEEKIKEFITCSQERPNQDSFTLFESASAQQLIKEILNELQGLPAEKQKTFLKEMLDIKFAMYRAAVNAAQRYKNEYSARQDIVMKKIKNQLSEINKTKQEIKDLYVKKDYLKLSESKSVPSVNPTIRVKNQVEKGTIIRGRSSSLILDQTIYGVKFSEKQKSLTDRPQIIIEGFYE